MATFNEKTIKDKNGDIVNNYVIISGRLGKDFIPFNGGERSSLAFYVRSDEDDAWIDIKTFTSGITKGLKKGDAVQIKGRLSLYRYKDRDGNEKNSFVIIFDRIEKVFAEDQKEEAH